MDRSAFKGIKVLDFSWALAGPLVTKYLADYGATVVRIESRNHPCVLRTSGPFKDNIASPDRTGYFGFFSPNKYSVVMELDKPGAQSVARRLAAWSDVVMENFVPGVMDRLGLGYEDLRKLKPELVMVSSSGQGQQGPFSRVSIAGNWLVVLSGFGAFTGWPDHDPMQPFGPYNDFIAPRFGAVALMAALRRARLTGKGQHIDISQLEAGIQFLAPAFLDSAANGREGNRAGNASRSAAPHGAYRCRDGFCALSVHTDEQWRGFCRMDRGSWTTDPRFATFLGRKQNEDELNVLVAELAIRYRRETLMSLLQEAGVPAGIVESPRDLVKDPQLQYRNQFWTLPHKAMGDFLHLGQAAILGRTPSEARMPSPLFGEHNEWVCKELLGMKDEEFIELLNNGVFGE